MAGHPARLLILLTMFLLPWQTVYILSQPVVNGGVWQQGTIAVYGIEVLVWASIIVMAVQLLRGGALSVPQQYRKYWWVVLPALFFFLYLLASPLWAVDSNLALQQSRRLVGAIAFGGAVYVSAISWRLLAGVWLCAGLVQAILGLWQWGVQQTTSLVPLGLVAHLPTEAGASVIVTTGERWLRAYGSFAHPNVLGGYLAISIFLAVLLYVTTRSPRWRAFFLASVVVLTAGFIVSWSRSAWLGLILALPVLWGSLSQPARRLFVVPALWMGVTVIVSAVLFFSIFQTRIAGGTAHEAQSKGERIESIPQAVALLRDHWLFGVGPGGYTAGLQQLQPGLPGWEYQPVHNIDLLVLVELGFVGGALLLAALLFYLGPFVRQMTTPELYALFSFFLLITGPAVLDHYLWTSVSGQLMIGVLCAIFLQFIPQLSTSSPEQYTQETH